MFNPYDILGIPRGSAKDVARAAYRKLAMKYHPDRNAGSGLKAAEEQFKKIQGAWEMIDNGWDAPSEPVRSRKPETGQRPASSFTKPEPVWKGFYDPKNDGKGFQAHNAKDSGFFKTHKSPFGSNPYKESVQESIRPRVIEAYKRDNLGEFVARPSMAEAYNGFILEVNVGGTVHQIPMEKGIPHGMRSTIPIGDGDITVRTLFTQNMYKFVGLDTAVREGTIVNSEPGVVFRTKDLKLDIEITPKELYNGKSIDVSDFLGETYTIKIPANRDSSVPPSIRIPGRGYVDWFSSHSKAGSVRGDVLVNLIVTEKVEVTQLRL